ncbi:hypothetical protein BN946_scf184962.g62 [Trametes cinnabarina]|uniref:F-box domain-containing protein n=1 Tax=Pycnoporus cinnabarinus TaxID=5643 RepID=A0A060SIQ5_PYCCI|nr:hypothetical protein BN946_scf184962.g62 [Trametes cinnabarina]
MTQKPHPVWTIPEVLREIMRHNAHNEQALARCARVSRAFSDPAIEVLWEEQRGLGALFALMPRSIRKVAVGVDQDDDAFGIRPTSFVLIDTIQAPEWERMSHYARLVRTYISDGVLIDGLCASVILQKLAGKPLLPRLRRLDWKLPFDQSSFLAFFLSPMLRSVHLDLLEGDTSRFTHDQNTEPTASEYAYGTALQLFQSLAPNLENLHMWTSGFHCSMDRLVEFRNLRVLKLELIRYPGLVLQTASALPGLRKLSIYFSGTPHDQAGPPHPETCLPSLRCLKLHGVGTAIIPFIAAVSAPLLRTIMLSFMAMEAQWKECADLIVSRFGSSLRELDFDVEDAYDDPNPYLFDDWFSALYALRRLHRVSINSMFETPFIITAQDIDRMTSAWPRIRFLLIPAVQQNPSLMFPITALESFAEKCPRLRQLVIPIPDHGPLEGPTEPAVSRQHDGVQEIRLLSGRWPENVHDKCMAYLNKLFPNAEAWIFDNEWDDDGELLE